MFRCLVIFLLFNLESWAFEVEENAEHQSIDAIVGWTKPPYVIEMNNSGFELELVAAVFAQAGITVQYSYVPHGRLSDLLKQGKADIALTLSPKLRAENLNLSLPYIHYQNAVISLKSSNISLEKIEDIVEHSVVAFQNATKVLGEEYHAAVARNLRYMEVPLQSRQVELLVHKRADIAVMDVNIFNYLSRHLTGSSFMNQVNIDYFFSSTPYHLGCLSTAICELFNQQLLRFLATPAYKQLVEKYEFIQRKVTNE